MIKILILFAAALIGIWLLPPLLIIGAVIICIVYGVWYYNSYPMWLERVGIGPLDRAPGGQRIHDWAIERGYAEMFDREESVFFAMAEGVPLKSGYVLSTKFRDKILRTIDQKRIMTESEFQRCCRAAAPLFREDYADILAGYLSDREDLLEVSNEGPYLSMGMVEDCEQLLNKEGAATEIEFAELCEKSMSSWLYEPHDAVAEAILNNMVSCGRAEKVAHTESTTGLRGEFLYVSNNPSLDCKMTKREINLD